MITLLFSLTQLSSLKGQKVELGQKLYFLLVDTEEEENKSQLEAGLE